MGTRFDPRLEVERVQEYKYLGTVIDSKLNFNANTDAIHKKCQSRLFCLQKLRSLNVNQSLIFFLSLFLRICTDLWTRVLVCWFECEEQKNVGQSGECQWACDWRETAEFEYCMRGEW
jgi:hypothetical protein